MRREQREHHWRHTGPVLLFSNEKNLFFGYFDPENVFVDNENNNFWGDLTDVSARKRSTAQDAEEGKI